MEKVSLSNEKISRLLQIAGYSEDEIEEYLAGEHDYFQDSADNAFGLTETLAFSQQGINMDWRSSPDELLGDIRKASKSLGVEIQYEDDDALEINIPLSIVFPGAKSPQSFVLNTKEDSNPIEEYTFGIVSLLNEFGEVRQLSGFDGTDGFGFLLLNHADWTEVRKLFGTEFDAFFTPYGPDAMIVPARQKS